ncbi:MAG: DNA-3-methyladenine glycosylase 2 family protein [Clostridia bacterium]|nr:DNA-3-methyladenine glycosylase 2 family protein [Clostridia bacterium]
MKKKLTKIIVNNWLNVDITLDCGQAFRWKKLPDGGMHGVACGRALTVRSEGEKIIFEGSSEEDFENIWKAYFDLGRDYEKICAGFRSDPALREAVEFCPGIRILRQEPWEALCSFIISQNNNIPRIKGIIERLCETLGDDLGGGDFTFPSAEKVACAGPEALAPLRAGFRNKYIIDAARKVADGTVDFDKINTMSDEDAAAELKKIKGVGDKVAACALLYGFGRVDCLPVDVWVKRILAETYPGGLPGCTDGVRGIAQQYLFHWRRNAEKE